MVKITPVPVREDNYSYIISEGKRGVFVDVFDLGALQQAAKRIGVESVEACISTHHHQDHTGGNNDFAAAYPKAPIYGGSDKIPRLTKRVSHHDSFPLLPGSSVRVTAHHTPCHTQDSTCFLVDDGSVSSSDPSQASYRRGVFTGDTLFVSGCGRFFEGDAAQMNVALNVTLAALPDDAYVFCGHEYTRSNVAFSSGVLPEREAVQSLVRFVREGRNAGVTTGVFTVADEKRHNVFMLVRDAEVKRRVGLAEGASADEVMATLRELKNQGKMVAKI